MLTLEALRATPNAIASDYTRARVSERILLSGHSHQAWPDCGLAGQERAWSDAVTHLDEKWERAFAVADRVARGYAALLGDRADRVALGANTFELVTRFLSALPLESRPKLITSDGEFHTIRRLFDRLAEEGLEIVRLSARPVATLSERLADAVDERTAAVLVSSVLFQTAERVPELGALLAACQAVGAELLVDVYHELNAIPFSIARAGLEGAFIVGGGYKYCQLGEGNAFLRIPPDCTMRPVLTGWYSEFSALEGTAHGGPVAYGPGAARFAGATYDPTSHYRAAEVFDFFERRGLHPELLRVVSQHQIGLLARAFDDLDLPERALRRDRTISLERLGGFLTLESPHAGTLSRGLRARGVLCDSRGDALRLGPAPYLSDRQLRDGIAALEDAVRALPA